MHSRRKWLLAGLGTAVVVLALVGGVFLFSGERGESVQGHAKVPTGEVVQVTGVLEVGDHLVHLVGLVGPREEPDCRLVGGAVVQCTVISAAKLAEIVAGKSLRCDIYRFGKDDRNWGVCRATDVRGDKLEDTVNGQQLLAGWALPNKQQGAGFQALGDRARDAQVGMWAGPFAVHRVVTGNLFGNPEINDANTVEIEETRIRLLGIDAPDLDQQCKLNGLPYACGLQAYLQLITIVTGKGRILCVVTQAAGDDRGWGKCGIPNEQRPSEFRAGVPSFNELMVRSGWALADRARSTDYVAAEDEARAAKRGLWAGEFIRPAEWRNGKR